MSPSLVLSDQAIYLADAKSLTAYSLTDGATMWSGVAKLNHYKTPDLSLLAPEQVTRPHLIPSPGFLSAIPHHRTFWTIDTTIRYHIAAARGAAHGDILVMDGSQFYKVRGYLPGRDANFDPRPNGYTLLVATYSITNAAAAKGTTATREINCQGKP